MYEYEIIFTKGFSNAIDRKLFGSDRGPFLCKKNTVDSRNSIGKVAVEIALLQMHIRKGRMLLPSLSNAYGDKPIDDVALLVDFAKAASTSSPETGRSNS